MGERSSRPKDEKVSVRLSPLGGRGLDLFTRADMLAPDFVRAADNLRFQRGAAERRLGYVRAEALANAHATGAKDFNGTTQKVVVPFKEVIQFSAEPWAQRISFKTTRPASIPASHHGATLYGREDPDGSHDVCYGMEMDTAGVLYAIVTPDPSGTAVVLTTPAFANNDVGHALMVWDPHTSGGKLALYVNGDLVDSETGLGAMKPHQDPAAKLYFAVTSSDGAADEANSFWGGHLDSAIAWSWPGRRLTTARANGRSLLDTLRRYSWRDWVNPDGCVWHYGFDEPSGTVLVDASQNKNHGVYTGPPTAVTGLVAPSSYGHALGVVERSQNGERVLYAQAGGQTFRQILRRAVT